MATAIVAASATFIAAIIGSLLTYFQTRRTHERNDRLAWTNRQLGELYGPLFALTDSTRISFEAFCSKYGDVRREKDNPSQLSKTQREAWRRWMTEVFYPSDKRKFELIMTKADLLVDDTMPSCISEFCAHVSGYDVVMSQWARDDFTELFATVDYPSGFTRYVERNYAFLKERQSALLAAKLRQANSALPSREQDRSELRD